MELGKRLERVLSMVRAGSVIYDIGSDHGYLPMELVKRGICTRAVVTDVNKGPLERGKLTFRENGLTGKAQFFLTDGLSGLYFSDVPCDVTICGMGGELIAAILDARHDIWEKDVRFILQPMTKSEHLRAYLWENGFEIREESAVSEGDKSYIILSALYKGEKKPYTEVEAYLGKASACENSYDADVLYGKIVASFEKKCGGMKKAGQDVSQLEAFIAALKNEAETRKDR
ncbi:MAG: SAM-dependent methyltransferase [Ruminococcaceae bacterium]|nr:SAM-dependent methyltransferase [Oscillospiraceae bacterium]